MRAFRGDQFMKIEISRLAVEDYGKWDELLPRSAQIEIYHDSRWLRIAEKHTNTELFLLIATMNSEIVGGIPLFLDRKYGGLFKRLMSPPYPSQTQIPNLGPIITHYQELKQSKRESRLIGFQSALDEYIYSKIKPDFVQVVTTPSLMDIRPFQWSGYNIVPRFTYIGDIENSELSWWRLETETRREIKKAEQMGVEVEEGGLNEYKYIYDSYIERHREQGIDLNLSWDYLFEVFKEFYPINLRVFIAKHQGENIGGHVFLTYDDKVTFWLGGVRSKLRETYQNQLLAWKVIQWAADHGYRYYEDVGGNHPSISAFKSKFGFDLKIYFEISKSSSKYRILRKFMG